MKNRYHLRAVILPLFVWLLAILPVQTTNAQAVTGPEGGNQPFSTIQPSLALNYIIAVTGIYPLRDGSDFDQDTPYLGEIFLFAGNFAPAGYMFANGAVLQIAQNTALFSLLGTTYGGNGQTTFALPDLRGRIPVGMGQGPGLPQVYLGEWGGSETVTLTSAQMASHSHTLSGGGATEATGGSQSFNNLQPYVGINFVMAVDGIFPIFSEIRMFAGNFSPGGYFANGSLLSIDQNTALFNLLGTTYGGDGLTTFALPDLRGRVPVGAGNGPGLSSFVIGQQAGTPSVMMTINQLPGHTHSLSGGGNTNPAGSGNPIENRQPYLAIRYIICTSGIYPSQSGGIAAIPLIGQVRPYAAGWGLPNGWAEADGSLLQISSNQALFNVLGTTYGGDGLTTFALPDMRGRVPVGAGNGPGLSPVLLGQRWGGETVTLTSLNLPSHTHTVYLLDGGEIAADQTICYGAVPSPFTSISPATGFVGELEYKWQISTVSPTFVDIPGAVSETYTHVETVTQTTWFRRLAKGTSVSLWVESNVVQVTVNPTRLFVTESGAGLMNGSSWDNAFSGSQLQTAINAQCVTEVWVASGTYKPTTGTNRAISFSMKNGVAIYGGFNGTEDHATFDLAERDFVLNETILSGDIGTQGDNNDNSHNVFFNTGLNNTAILNGFTISGGADAGGIVGRSRGMYNNSSSPSIVDCVFLNSFADFGGGMFNHSSSPLILNCSFIGNSAGGWGGGMYNYFSQPTLRNCIFSGNSANEGGGMLNDQCSPTLINCSFSGNKANYGGGGMLNFDLANPVLINCIIWNNSAAGSTISPFASIQNLDSYPSVYYSLIANSGGSGFNNIDIDPLFITPVDPATAPTTSGNLRLQACSPAINAGDNASVPSGITTDLDGSPRFYNNGIVDMGAYEFQGEKNINPTNGGQIAASQVVCIGDVPTPFTSVSPASGFVGDLEYQWQISTVSPTFDDIPGAVFETYTHFGTVTQTTWFRRLAKVECESEWVESNLLQINVLQIADQSVTANPEVICFNTSGEVIIGSSQAGTTYYLRNSSDNSIVSGPMAGTGNALTFSTGTLTNTTTFNILAEKPVSSALEMDGTNDYISFQQDLSSVTNFTYEAWIYQKGNNLWQRIFDFGNAAGFNIFLTSSIGFTGVPRFVINIGAGEQQVTAPSALPLNTWTHIAVTLNGNQAIMYINGALVAQNNAFSYTPASLGATVNNWIGRSQYPVDGYYNGKIDEVRIWNVTRSQAQIQESMNRCLVGNESGLLAYYNFAEGTGNSFTGDVTGNGRTGTLVNMNPVTVWVSGSISCTECERQLTNEVIVTVDPLPTATSGGSQSVCVNGSATVSGASSSNGTILWTHNGAGSLSDETTLTPTYTPDAGEVGNTVLLTMTVTSNNTCGTATATATYSITVNPLPTASAGGSATICETSSHQVSGASSSNGTILWTHNGSGTLTQATTLTPTYNPVSADGGKTITLTLTVTSNNACNPQTASAQYTVNVDPATVAGSISGNSSVIYGSTTGDLTLSGYTGDIQKWQKRYGTSGGWTDIAHTDAIYSETPTSVGTWQYRAVVKSGVCSQAETAPHTLTVEPKELTIGGAFTAKDKIYDTNTDAEFDENNLTLVGVVGSDDVSLTGMELNFASQLVGTHTVTITAASLDGADKDNYTLTLAGSPTATASIQPGPPHRFLVTETDDSDITSPKLQNIPFDVKLTLVDSYDNPTPNTVGTVTVTLTGEGGLVTGTLSVQGAIGDPVEKVLNIGENELTFSNILYSGLSDIPGFDVKLSASATGTGTASGITGESNLFSVRGIIFDVVADPTSIIADGVSTATLTITLLDHGTAPLANQVISVETDYGTLMDGLTELPSTVTATTDANGQVILHLRSASVVGLATVTARCPGACPQSAQVEFVPGPPAKLAFTTQPPASTVANQPFAQQPVVTIQDATGNTVPTATHEVALTLTSGTGTLNGTTVMNAVSGIATFAGLSIDLAGTDKVLTASATSLDAATTSPTFTILPSDPASFAITGPDVLSAGVQSGDYTITIHDEYGNPTNVSAATIIQMSTSSTGSNSFAPLQVTIPSGTSTGAFRYTDHQLTFPGDNTTLTGTFVSGDAGLAGETADKAIEVTAGNWIVANTNAVASGNTDFYPGSNWPQDVFRLSATGQSTTTRDVHHVVYQDVCDEQFTIIARLTGMQNLGWGGVVVRQGTGNNDRTILVKTQLSNRVIVGYRKNPGLAMVNSGAIATIKWMKIQRNGTNSKVFTSANGTTWQQRYNGSLDMTGCLKAGIFLESIYANRTAVATFDNVELATLLKSSDENTGFDLIQPELQSQQVEVYPNPADDYIIVSIPENDTKVNYQITDMDGRLIEQNHFTGSEAVLDLSNFKPGMYVLRLEVKGEIVTRRIVVM